MSTNGGPLMDPRERRRHIRHLVIIYSAVVIAGVIVWAYVELTLNQIMNGGV